MFDRKKLLGAAAITASIAGGGIAGALLAVPALSAAQEQTTTTEEGGHTAGGHDHLIARAGEAGCAGFHHLDLTVAAEALGMGEDELADALADGSSIADVAGEREVDLQAVIEALVAAATVDIDQAVADGDLDAERAAELKEGLSERVTAFVNGELPGPGVHEGRAMGRHH